MNIKQIQLFLGPARIKALIALLAITGLVSILLSIPRAEWTTTAQTSLVFVWLVGSLLIIGSALDAFDRGRWASILAPALGALLIGVFFLPDRLMLMAGLAAGWTVAGLFIFKPRGPMEYQQAVRHLRKSRYKEAVQVMDSLIKLEPDKANHYRFRAEILRIWGQLGQARRDYKKMTQLTPDSAVAYNGLAEVELQARNYEAAHQAALRAYQLAPNEWVATYNLGMIEDRLGQSEHVIDHLNQALAAKVPDARHRLLIHFYLARAHARLGQFDAARQAIKGVKKHGGGLNEWQVILQSDQAQTLRDVIQGDIEQAQALAQDMMAVEDLAEQP